MFLTFPGNDLPPTFIVAVFFVQRFVRLRPEDVVLRRFEKGIRLVPRTGIGDGGHAGRHGRGRRRVGVGAPRGVNRKVQETERFLQDVLNNMRDEEYILQGQRYIGLKFKRFIHTIVIYARKTELFPPISYYDLSKRMADMLPDCFGFLFRNSILLLLSSDEEIGDFGELLQDVRPIMEKYNLIAGISNSFGSILGLSAHCFQSCKALQLGSVLHPEKTLYSYRDYSVYYMIELCLKNDDLTAFCLPEIAKLIEHSNKDSGDLLNTLRIYLRCGRSKSQTAREMFVHLNTVKYRLQQIQSIIGLDFDNDDNALKLMLSFKMLEYKEKFQSYEPMDIMGR